MQHLQDRKSMNFIVRQTGKWIMLGVSVTLHEPRWISSYSNQHVEDAALDFCSYSDFPTSVDAIPIHLESHVKNLGIILDSSLSPCSLSNISLNHSGSTF